MSQKLEVSKVIDGPRIVSSSTLKEVSSSNKSQSGEEQIEISNNTNRIQPLTNDSHKEQHKRKNTSFSRNEEQQKTKIKYDFKLLTDLTASVSTIPRPLVRHSNSSITITPINKLSKNRSSIEHEARQTATEPFKVEKYNKQTCSETASKWRSYLVSFTVFFIAFLLYYFFGETISVDFLI